MISRSRSAIWLAAAFFSGCSGTVAAPSAAPPGELTRSPSIGPATTEADPKAMDEGAAPANAKNVAGEPEKAAPPADNRPRLGATGPFAYIYKRAEPKGLALGYIRMGTAVPLRSAAPVAGPDCPRGWYAVEPRGYACLNKV